MLTAADAAVVVRAPVVTVRRAVIGEADAVRATLTRASPRVVYRVRLQIRGGAAAGSGCVASASVSVRTGSTPGGRFALAPRGAWCPGLGVLTAAAARPGAAVGVARVRVRPAAAIGQGNVVGRLLLGPTCPVERANDPCDPVAHPQAVTLVALAASGARAAHTVTLSDGSFALDLPAGSYTLHAERTGASYPSIADAAVVVTAHATRSRPERVIVTGDTGIR